MVFKLYNADCGFVYNGVTYQFDHVENVQIEDPERTRLIRGSNAGNKIGLDYKEGLKEAKVVTMTVIAIPMDVHNLLKTIYSTKARIEVFCIDKSDGSSKIAKNALLSQSPKQLSLDDSAESLNTALIFESFDIDEVMKS